MTYKVRVEKRMRAFSISCLLGFWRFTVVRNKEAP